MPRLMAKLKVTQLKSIHVQLNPPQITTLIHDKLLSGETPNLLYIRRTPGAAWIRQYPEWMEAEVVTSGETGVWK